MSNKLNNNSSLRQVFERFIAVTNNVEELNFIINSMKRAPCEESQTYTATDEESVVGEVYYVKTSGVFKLKCEGSGSVSYTIKHPETLVNLYSGELKNDEESDVLYLTVGDVCYFNVVANIDKTESVTLHQTKTIFELMTEYAFDSNLQIDSINSRINNLILNLDEIIPHVEFDEKNEQLIINTFNDMK